MLLEGIDISAALASEQTIEAVGIRHGRCLGVEISRSKGKFIGNKFRKENFRYDIGLYF